MGNLPSRASRGSLVGFAWFCLLLAVVPARSALAAQTPAADPPIKRIVCLFGDEVTIPGNVRTDRGLRIGFAKDLSVRTEIYQEYLDLARFGSEAYEQRLASVLSQKYGGRQPDLLVAISPLAVLFAAKWAPIVFPGVPIVYVCPSRATVSVAGPDLNATGVLGAFDFRGTIEAALRFRPRAHRVVIVSGASRTDHEYLELARPDLTELEGQVSFEYLIGLPMGELLDRVARLPQDTVVLYTSIFRDGTGQDFQPPDAVEKVAARSSVPVFGPVLTYLGRGIVGGHLFDWEKAGVRAAELALQVLHGASPRKIPPSSEGLCSWVFDARQLKRWGIRESALPAGSQVLFKPPSLWRERPWAVMGTILFMLAETALIVGLVLERRWRRRAEGRQRLLSAIVESSNDAVIGVDLEQRIVSWNLGAQKIFGYTSEEAVGHLAELLVPPQHLREAYSAFARVIAGQTIAPFETVRLRKDGSQVAVSINDSPIHDPRGRIIGISSTQRDMTEHNQMQQALRRSEEHLRLATATAELAPWVWYLDEDSIWATEIGFHLYGLEPREKLNMAAVLAVIHPEDREAARAGLQRALRDPEGHHLEHRVVWPNGETRWLSTSGRCQFDDNGKPTRMIGISADITDRKRAELESQQLQQELAHFTRVTMMGELTSSLAHELNQPLTAILSNAQTAQRLLAARKKPDPEELGEILSDIVADDERAGGIIGRLRALLKKGQPDLQPVDLNGIVREVAGLVRSDTIIKNISLTLDLAPELPPVRGDRVQLQQVILNLMINAIDAMTATPGGDRSLVARTERGDGMARVTVRDSGIGIPLDGLERVFEAFYTTKQEGMGMGLAIARSIARAHGGKLWGENNSTGGATFTLALPTVQ